MYIKNFEIVAESKYFCVKLFEALSPRPDVLVVPSHFASLYNLGEALRIPVVGLHITCTIYQPQLRAPWDSHHFHEPAGAGSLWSEDQIRASTPWQVANFLHKVWSLGVLAVAAAVNNLQVRK